MISSWGVQFTKSQKNINHLVDVIFLRKFIYLVIFSGKHLDAHDGEDEPEDEADEKHVEDAGDGLNQCVDDNLGKVDCSDYFSTNRMVSNIKLLIIHC